MIVRAEIQSIYKSIVEAYERPSIPRKIGRLFASPASVVAQTTVGTGEGRRKCAGLCFCRVQCFLIDIEESEGVGIFFLISGRWENWHCRRGA